MTEHRKVLLGAATLLAAGACFDGKSPTMPEPLPDDALQRISCTADVRAGTLACIEPTLDPASGLSLSLTLGGQGLYVQLTSSGVSYDGTSELFEADVTVQNLIGQALGTTDGTTLAPEGVRVFFHSGPTVTEGEGTVTVANATGTGTFTAGEQPYFQYDEVLDPDETSGLLNWQWNVPSTVTTFAFEVFVTAPVQHPDGWIEVSPSSAFIQPDATVDLVATVRDPLGRPVVAGPGGTTLDWTLSPGTSATLSATTVIPEGESSVANDVTGVTDGTELVTVSVEPSVGTGAATVWIGVDFSASWAVDPPVSYSCASGLIDIQFSSLTAIHTDPAISFTAEGDPPGTMEGSVDGAGTFAASRVIAGGVTETYTLLGTFTTNSTFEGTFSASYSGGGTDCTNQTWEVTGTLPPEPSPSEQIAAARAAPDGAASLPIASVLVTYVKPFLGSSDPAGFFIQAEATGPALFIAVDPAGLTPVPVAGDEVSFTITQMGTAAALRQATVISGYTSETSGHPLGGLLQDVTSAVDLVTNVTNYESELIHAAGDIAGAFEAAGSGYAAADFHTTGVSNDPLLKLRVPTALVASLDLATGCSVTLDRVPMWRFNTTAQVSAWVDGDFTDASCPAPAVIGAEALSSTSVVVEFDRLISAMSVSDDGSQFTVDNGLTVSGATVSGTLVTLTTSTQAEAVVYTVSVANSVTDTYGTSVDPAANSATFTGYVPPPPSGLVINEVDYDQVGTDAGEFIEIYNPTVSAVDLTNMAVVLVNGSDQTEYARFALSGSLAAGAYLVLANAGVTVNPGASVLTIPDNTIQNGSPDGIALFDTETNTLIDALSYEGEIGAAVITGAPVTYDLVEGTATAATDSNTIDGSLNRTPNGADTDDASADWTFTSTSTPGAANVSS